MWSIYIWFHYILSHYSPFLWIFFLLLDWIFFLIFHFLSCEDVIRNNVSVYYFFVCGCSLVITIFICSLPIIPNCYSRILHEDCILLYILYLLSSFKSSVLLLSYILLLYVISPIIPYLFRQIIILQSK